MIKDFTPTKESISLHGLGFIQLKLEGDQRMHVWHPDLPRRKCYKHSYIHNHRFTFKSTVIKGTQINVRCDIELVQEGTHDVISHNGPRIETGSRLSYPVAQCNVHKRPTEFIKAGDTYHMPAHQYHFTPVEDLLVATVMKKGQEWPIHANSICERGIEFDYSFDRFQLPPEELFEYVKMVLMA